MLSVLLVCILGVNLVQASGKWNEASESKQMSEVAAPGPDGQSVAAGDRRVMEDRTSLSASTSLQSDWKHATPAQKWFTTALDKQEKEEAKAKRQVQAAAQAKAKKEAALKLAGTKKAKAAAATTTPPTNYTLRGPNCSVRKTGNQPPGRILCPIKSCFCCRKSSWQKRKANRTKAKWQWPTLS